MNETASLKKTSLHGSARWANKKDMSADILLQIGSEDVFCFAPTRSGKGVGLVIPTLLSGRHSAVITDLKADLCATILGRRQQNKVLRCEFATLHGSIRWNPLDEIRTGTESEVGDVQNLALLIIDPDGKGLESHWQKTAHALLVGLILHLLYKSKKEGADTTLPAVDSMLSEPNHPISDLWLEMKTYPHIDGKNHHIVGSCAQAMIEKPEKEVTAIISSATSYLSFYREPVNNSAYSTDEEKQQ